jgi:hypothetical protein
MGSSESPSSPPSITAASPAQQFSLVSNREFCLDQMIAGAPQAPALQDDHPENESSFPSPVPFPRDFEILDSEILRVGALGAAPCSAASSEQSRKTASLVSLWRPRFKRQTSGFRPSASLSDPAAQDRDRRFRQLVERIGGSVYRRFRRRTVRVGMSAGPFTVPLIFVGAEGDAVDVA